jgi:hypothetical protein
MDDHHKPHSGDRYKRHRCDVNAHVNDVIGEFTHEFADSPIIGAVVVTHEWNADRNEYDICYS